MSIKSPLVFFGRVFLRLFLALLAVSCLIVIFELWLNRADVPATDLAKEFEESLRNAAKVPDQENAYVYMLGLASANADSPLIQGVERKDALEGVIRGENIDVEAAFLNGNRDYKGEWSPEVLALNDACKFTFEENCLARLEESDMAIKSWEETQSWLLDRYQILLSFSKYKEIIPTDHQLPLVNYSAAIDAQKLYLAHLWRMAKTAPATSIQSQLERDFLYWRMILSSSDRLITKTVAWRALKRNLSEGNFILRRLAERTAQDAIPKSWHIPLTHEEISIYRVAAGEWYQEDQAYKNLDSGNFYRPNSGFERPPLSVFQKTLFMFFQPQDTSNRLARIEKEIVNLFETPIDNFYSAHAKTEQYLLSESKSRYQMYNVAGGYILDPIYLFPHNVAIKLSDLEIGRRAALLTAKLRLQNLSAKQRIDYVRQSELKDLYTGRSFDLSSKNKISFFGLEKGERGAYFFFL